MLKLLCVLFTTFLGAWSDSCGPQFKGKCYCGTVNYQDKEQYVVNCTNTQFTDSTMLESLPEEVEVSCQCIALDILIIEKY